MKNAGWLIKFIILLWTIIIVVGFSWLTHYSNTPGDSGPTSQTWPTRNSISFTDDKPNLFVFIHPKCSCSEATLNEVNRMMTLIENKVYLHIVFIEIENQAYTLNQSENWKLASRLPGSPMLATIDPAEANAVFGARTSGFTLLYSADKKLIYAGGVTPSRGHMGDSIGRDTILNYILFKPNGFKANVANVYGCSFSSDDQSKAFR